MNRKFRGGDYMATINVKLWQDKSKERLDPKLFSDTAERLAREIGEDGGRNRNKNSQIRRYFDEVVRLNTLAQQGDEEHMRYSVLPQVHMLVAKVVYAQGRKLVTQSFVDMMKESINQITDRKDMQVFTNFLESFMGFYKVYGPN